MIEIWLKLWGRLARRFGPPDAVKLGRVPARSRDSSYGVALPIRGIGDPNAYTWEDWEAEVRRDYPVRYWLFETVPRFLGRCSNRWWELVYWLKCQVLSTHAWHRVDLRNPGPGIDYTYGYIDPGTQILYASFAILRRLVKSKKFKDRRWDPEDSELERGYVEAQALYAWWMRERSEEHARVAEKGRTIDKSTPGWVDELDADDRALEEKDLEMLIRLMRIREKLWQYRE